MDERRSSPVGATPLHAQDPTGRFSGRAGEYTRHRPSYPAAAIDAALAGLGDGPLAIADVGAGTGISARLLADRGHRVVAIEPNAAMRGAAAPHAGVTWVAATAEATTLAEASVDAVVCAQAFHWFRPVEAARELARVLRPGGRLALIWNVRDERDGFTAEYSRVMDEASGGQSIDRGRFDHDAVEALGLFTPLALAEFPSSQSLDREGVIGRALSASYFPKHGGERDRLLGELGRVFERHSRGGAVAMVYRAVVWTADRT